MIGRLDQSPKGDRQFFRKAANDRAMSALGQGGHKLGSTMREPYPSGFTINTMVEVTRWLAALWPNSLIKIKVTSCHCVAIPPS
jgi:hypothetical protein